MDKHKDFLTLCLRVENLDLYIERSAILRALQESLANFSGLLLDIGCGTMPYKSLIMKESRVEEYLGLDFPDGLYTQYQQPDLAWDGNRFPLNNNSVDCAIATEVLEHCPRPEIVMREAYRVIKPGGVFFFTVPFLWPLHDVPYDEYRYTPFALERHLRNVGFEQISLKALGGWDASLAQMIGLWVRRRPLSPRKRKILSRLALPFVKLLITYDQPPPKFISQTMITGISGKGFKKRA